MGRAMMQIAAVFAQLERETIAERVQDNMLMLSYTGRWLGGQTICNLWNGSFGEGFRKEPIPVQRDKIKQVLQRAEWDREKLRLFLRGT